MRPQPGGSACVECVADTDHCHGTLVRHADRSVECTDVDCWEMGGDRHGFVINCRDLSGGCRCADKARTTHDRTTVSSRLDRGFGGS